MLDSRIVSGSSVLVCQICMDPIEVLGESSTSLLFEIPFLLRFRGLVDTRLVVSRFDMGGAREKSAGPE